MSPTTPEPVSLNAYIDALFIGAAIIYALIVLGAGLWRFFFPKKKPIQYDYADEMYQQDYPSYSDIDGEP